MTDDSHADADQDPDGDPTSAPEADDDVPRSTDDGRGQGPKRTDETAEGGTPRAGRHSRRAAEPDVSVTIEGKYDTVFERLEHPQSIEHGELDAIAGNIESTLLAVVTTGGGIRSEIYDAVDFELEDPWEIRLYLEVLEMHGLIRLQDDRWIPTDTQDRPESGDDAE